MPRSFFERLTGSVHVSEEEESAGSKREPTAARRGAKAAREAERRVIHPMAEEAAEIQELAGEPAAEEGQLTVDIYDDGQHIVIQSSVAGVKLEDIDISLQDDTLTIRGSRRRTQEIADGNFYYKELYWGSFSRSIILPEEVDFAKADAVVKNGLLTIKLPKKDRGEKKIRVKAAE